MNTIERLEEDFKQALKAKSEAAISTLRMVKSALKNKQIELQRELQEEDVLTVLQSQVKQLSEALDGAVKAGRAELEARAKEELALLKKYLPAELSDEELQAAVHEVIDDLKAAAEDMGKVMGIVMQKVKGRAGGQRVRAMVEKLLK